MSLFPVAAQKFISKFPIEAFPRTLSDDLFECLESYVTLGDISAVLLLSLR
jgi:hypothetical protein